MTAAEPTCAPQRLDRGIRQGAEGEPPEAVAGREVGEFDVVNVHVGVLDVLLVITGLQVTRSRTDHGRVNRLIAI